MLCSPSLRVLALGCALLCGAAQAQNPAPAPAPAATTTGATPGNPAPAATTAAEPAPAPSARPSVGDHDGGLGERIPPQQLLWLETGEDRFPARYQPDLSGRFRGAVILLHDSGRHPGWPATMDALVDALPLHGWTVLAIALPAPAQDRSAALAAPTPPPATTAEPAAATAPAEPEPAPPPGPATAPPAAASEPAPAGKPDAPAAALPERLERQAQARIQAALDHLVEQRQTTVAVIGFGSGALRGAEFVRQRAAGNGAGLTAPVAALGLVAPLQQLPGLTAALPKLLPATTLPTLDLTLRNDRRARAEADARRRAVLHQRDRDYLQLELPPVNPALDADHNVVVKRLRGWLQRHVPAEPDKAPKQARAAAP